MNKVFLADNDPKSCWDTPIKDDDEWCGVGFNATNEELGTILNIAVRNKLCLILKPFESEDDYDLVGGTKK